MKINKLIPLEKNPFKGSGDDQIKKIAASIETFGKMMEIRKIVIDEAFTILGGNKRYFACKELGMKDIPDSWIDQRTDLTEAEKKEFIVKDNAHYGSAWDYEILTEWEVPIAEWGVAADEAQKKIDAETKGEIEFSQTIDDESNYLVLKFTKDIDFLNAVSKLNVTDKYSMLASERPHHKGIGRVIDGVKIMQMIPGW